MTTAQAVRFVVKLQAFAQAAAEPAERASAAARAKAIMAKYRLDAEAIAGFAQVSVVVASPRDSWRADLAFLAAKQHKCVGRTTAGGFRFSGLRTNARKAAASFRRWVTAIDTQCAAWGMTDNAILDCVEETGDQAAAKALLVVWFDSFRFAAVDVLAKRIAAAAGPQKPTSAAMNIADVFGRAAPAQRSETPSNGLARAAENAERAAAALVRSMELDEGNEAIRGLMWRAARRGSITAGQILLHDYPRLAAWVPPVRVRKPRPIPEPKPAKPLPDLFTAELDLEDY